MEDYTFKSLRPLISPFEEEECLLENQAESNKSIGSQEILGARNKTEGLI